MRVLICGDRNWSDEKVIEKVIIELPVTTVIIQGGARGADSIAEKIARQRGMDVLTFRAEWEKYGRSAGPIRNREMLIEGMPDLVIAFHQDLEHSKGTKNMVEQARKAGIQVNIYGGK